MTVYDIYTYFNYCIRNAKRYLFNS